MSLPTVLSKNQQQITVICERHGVQRLYVFGSVLTIAFDEQASDLDFVVELYPMPPLERGKHLIAMQEELENLFGRKVDVLARRTLHNPYFLQELNATQQLVYESESQKIFI